MSKFYWMSYCVALVTYLIYTTIYLTMAETIPPVAKLIPTGIILAVLIVLSFVASVHATGTYWKAILLWPFSLVLWATIVDAYVGLVFHGDILYMSENTFPDKYVLWFVQNGGAYAFFKFVTGIGFASFLSFFKRDFKPR